MKITKRTAAVIVLALAAAALAAALGTAEAANRNLPHHLTAPALSPAVDTPEDVELDEAGRPDLRED
ncbi:MULTISPECIES: hypothetical protein [Streptomyces]|uniref:hypothetical protein n=1 Tax=Streptomyces TaxID=1883 RepID=UPI001F2CA5FF|nr:hypothetical protein [Streptomyces olivochromogenes]MCF3136891.1 hypothetical protein [Streptomyces olivochromogenes]